LFYVEDIYTYKKREIKAIKVGVRLVHLDVLSLVLTIYFLIK